MECVKITWHVVGAPVIVAFVITVIFVFLVLRIRHVRPHVLAIFSAFRELSRGFRHLAIILPGCWRWD